MYKLKLAIRYLVRRRISYFAIAAVALCVFVVLVVITVLTGLTVNFKGKVQSSVGDCVVHSKSLVGFGYYEEFMDMLKEQPYVAATTPIVKAHSLITIRRPGRSGYDVTREVMGIEPESFAQVTGFGDWTQFNKSDLTKVFELPYDANLPGCVPGIEILYDRDNEGNFPAIDKPPQVALELACIPLTAKGRLARAGAGEFSSKTFYCSDLFRAGYSLDWKFVFIPFDEAQLLLGMGTGHKRINAIHIKFIPTVTYSSGSRRVAKLWDDFVANKAGAKNANLLKEVKVQSWHEYSRMLVALVETQQTMMIVCFMLIGVITVFIVLVVFYMIVSHKSKDIGILKSIGDTGFGVVSLFLSFAVMIGLIGSAIGVLAGWQFLAHINEFEDWLFEHYDFQLWDRSISSIGDIPNAIDPTVLVAIIVSAVGACVLGALLPTIRAAKLKPVETLQVTQL